MALRLLEMVLREKDSGEVRELLKHCKVIEHRQIRLADGEVLVRILLDAEQSETVLDLLENRAPARRAIGWYSPGRSDIAARRAGGNRYTRTIALRGKAAAADRPGGVV